MKRERAPLAIRLSIYVALLMMAGKLTAYELTGSAAILSDAAESIVHLVATAVSTLSFWYSRQPLDRRHPYGHGKVAYFSAGFEGAMISAAGCFILYAALRDLWLGPELRQLGLGALITLGLALVNLALARYLLVVGRRENLLILRANGRHLMTDVVTSIGVFVGVLLVWLTGLRWLDPLLAILVALHILWHGGALLKQAFQGLIDEADPDVTQSLTQCLDQAKEEGLIQDYHQLRHRRSDQGIWVELHLIFPSDTSLNRAHQAGTEVERRLGALYPHHQVYPTTHLEPQRHERDHPDGHPELERN